MDKSICEIVRKNENDYISVRTNLSKYVQFSMYETIEKIDAYLNSKHVSGETDSLGRDKPFFNIVTAAVNIWYRATDLDRKDIQIKPTKSTDILEAFLATIHLQDWMRRENFGVFLNDWGIALARYGSSVIKFVEQGGKLHIIVTPWNRLIVDTVDFDNNVRIEILWLTPAQLKQRAGYDQEQVDSLINAIQARQTIGRQKKDTKNNYIKLYEVHGLLPLNLLTGKDKDKTEYVQQMHVVSFVGGKAKGSYDDYTLIKGKEAKDPYMITHLIPEDGRSLAIGAVEHLFEAQWMTNHTAKSIKDQLDLASKLIFQTADGNFVGQNALSSIENGDILIHSPNNPLTQVQNNSHDITSLQSFGTQWQNLAKEITSTPDAISGNNLPSGTAYKQAAMVNQEAHSLFEIMTQNKGLAVEQMLRDFILPYIKKQMNHSKEISTTLSGFNLQQIDMAYVNAEAIRRSNKKIADQIFNGIVAQPTDMDAEKQGVQGELASQGNTRFFKPSDVSDKTWAELLANLEWDVECDITGEASDKAATMTTLSTVLQTIASNPSVLSDPNAKLIFNKILEATGSVSPLELSGQAPQQQGPVQKPPIETINFKDAPPDVRVQMAKQAGITMQPQAAPSGGT